MKRIRIPCAAIALSLTVAACGRSTGHDSDTMQGMPGMSLPEEASPNAATPGMQGMAAGDAGGPIRVTHRQAALAGITFAVAREAPLEQTVRAVAMAVPSERGLGIVNARVGGWVEKLHVEETGRWVRAGQPLLELYSPELVTAQEELLLARRLAAVSGGDSLLEAARRRLRLWSITDEQITELERAGEVRRTLTVHSEFTGHVLEKSVIEGQRIQPGHPLFRIADLSTIWVEPAIFEQDIPLVRVGQRAQVAFDALPGRVFDGRITFIHPTLEMQTRTLRVRVEVANPDFAIKSMMYGTVRIKAARPAGVLVPLTAVLPTGEQDLAFVVREGAVWPTPVVVAARGDDEILVADGLATGDTVVASATFLFDSESSLAAAIQGIMINMGMGLDMGGMPMQGGADTMPATEMPSPGRNPERRP